MKKKKEDWETKVEKGEWTPQDGKIKYGQINVFTKKPGSRRSLYALELYIPRRHKKKFIAAGIILGSLTGAGLALMSSWPLWSVIFIAAIVAVVGGFMGVLFWIS